MEGRSASLQELLHRVTVILVRPKYPENIGAAARAAINMGISRLAVVDRNRPDMVKVNKTATHNAARLVKDISFYDTLELALEQYSLVVGTTARRGRQRAA